MNPFVDEPEKAHFYTKYPSDDNYRVVWVKGKKAEVSEKGLFPCPIWKFNKVARVWLHERALPVDLSAAKFFSSDKIAIEVQVDLVAQVKETDRALIAVATSFNESFELLRTDVTSIVRKFCSTRQADAIHGAEKHLAEEIVNEMSSASSDSLFTIRSASVSFCNPLLEQAAERKVTSDIKFEESKTTEKRATELDQLRDTHLSSNLVAALAREANKIVADCANRTANAKTDREIKAADLQNLKDYSAVTEKLKTAILHMKPPLPEIYKELELARIALESARITNDSEMIRKALQEAMSVVEKFSGIQKNAAAIVIEHTNKTGPDKK